MSVGHDLELDSPVNPKLARTRSKLCLVPRPLAWAWQSWAARSKQETSTSWNIKAGMYELEYEARQGWDIELEAAGIGNPRLMSVDKVVWVATWAGRQRYTLPSIMSKHNGLHKMHLLSIYPSHI